ncbi:TetR/AcrR family transcriptional regulator [Streptacidiphilus sp. EB103A]|uniref:TetR/AcrR family transcriptional regulator n=1 Tax=Streptacidiphilus sp. EB103A TaxID=3156275 RepID=UPI00351581CC
MNDSMDPRAVRSREAMLTAARDLLQREGPAAVTHQRVAQHAGVGRATVYRHWPDAEQLLLETLNGVAMPFFRDPATPVRPWLHGQLRTLADEMALPAVAAVAVTLMQGALWEPHMAGRRDTLVATLAEQLSRALESARSTGELDSACDALDAAALLVGPILFRTTMQSGKVSTALIDHLIDSLGTWHSPGDD